MQTQTITFPTHTPIGSLAITATDTDLLEIKFITENIQSTEHDSHTLLKQTIAQLTDWIKNPHHPFTLPYTATGTPFQQRVWRMMQAIPCGETRTYQQLATALNTSPRAVGNACRANPLLFIIPCHRVVAKNHMGGFAGSRSGRWLEIKAWLLQRESSASY
jgi:methylated-DNA-[protein]-cysteine S-methyltransferase